MSSSTSSSELEALRVYLNRVLRIKISDGRVIEGEFQCIDRDMNFILGQATEYHGVADVEFNASEAANARSLGGMVMVPGAHILSCHAKKWVRTCHLYEESFRFLRLLPRERELFKANDSSNAMMINMFSGIYWNSDFILQFAFCCGLYRQGSHNFVSQILLVGN